MQLAWLIDFNLTSDWPLGKQSRGFCNISKVADYLLSSKGFIFIAKKLQCADWGNDIDERKSQLSMFSC